MATKRAATTATGGSECANCSAENPMGFAFCYACLCPVGVTNEMAVVDGQEVAIGEVGKPAFGAAAKSRGASATETKKERRARAARDKRAAQKKAEAS